MTYLEMEMKELGRGSPVRYSSFFETGLRFSEGLFQNYSMENVQIF